MAGVGHFFARHRSDADGITDAYARKIHYTCDVFFATSWGLITGFKSPFPWFYPLFFIAMITHRASRDIARCRERYGETWMEYERRVPYLFIPVSFAPPCLLFDRSNRNSTCFNSNFGSVIANLLSLNPCMYSCNSNLPVYKGNLSASGAIEVGKTGTAMWGAEHHRGDLDTSSFKMKVQCSSFAPSWNSVQRIC